MKMYEGPDLPREIKPNCPQGEHCYCRRLVDGQAYCCKCGFQPTAWMEIENCNPHLDPLLNGKHVSALNKKHKWRS